MKLCTAYLVNGGTPRTSVAMDNKSTSCGIQCLDKAVNTGDGSDSQQSLLKELEERKKRSSHRKGLSLFSTPAAMMKIMILRPCFGLEYHHIACLSLLNTSLPVVKPSFSLSPPDQFLLILMKLRIAFPLQN